MPIIDRIKQFHEDMTAWRRDIHAHPELGFQEQRTADFVGRKLESFGCEVSRGVGRTGVVGSLQIGRSSRAVGLRADMDALPIEEGNQVSYRSQHGGTMHACGHDGHTSMLLGAAKYLAESRNFDGTVHFIFQPGEEGVGGAKAMLDDGLFRRFPCDVIFGMHNRPGLPVGQFSVRPGPAMAGGAFFDIDVTGVGAHAARPQAGVDPVLAAAQIITALQSIVSRNVDPQATAIISVTQIHAGDAYNVIPERLRLSGTARAFDAAILERIGTQLQRVADGVARGLGAQAQIDYRLIFLPLVNNPQEAAYAADACAEISGSENVDRNGPCDMASEDFSFMLNAVPGAYVNLGNGESDTGRQLHNPNYDFNDAALPYGASLYARLIERRLGKA